MSSPQLLGFGTSIVLHVALVVMLWGAWSSAPASIKSAAAPGPVVISDARSMDMPQAGIGGPGGRARSELHIGGFRFDYRKIAESPDMLFPFLTRPLALERATSTARYHSGGLMNASAPTPVPAIARPLILSDKALQQLVDNAWSRRERWRPFRRIADLVMAPRRGEVTLARVVDAEARAIWLRRRHVLTADETVLSGRLPLKA